MILRTKRLPLLATLLWSATANAVPAPMSDADMLVAADLVVDAKAIAIICDGAPCESAQLTITNYLSTLTPSKSYKGGFPGSIQIRGKVEDWKTIPPTGGWFQPPVPEGWAGKLYLKKESDGTYSEVWWNGMQADSALSTPLPLPDCTIAADGGAPDGAPVADSGPLPDGAPVADSGPLPDDGLPADSTPAVGNDDGGCSCNTGHAPRDATGWCCLGALGLLALLRRRG